MELIRLAARYLRPYRMLLLGVLILQAIATAAALYLPVLNADIIDRGVAVGDTDYIWSTGRWMLVVTLIQVVCSIAGAWCGARAAMAASCSGVTEMISSGSREANCSSMPTLRPAIPAPPLRPARTAPPAPRNP